MSSINPNQSKIVNFSIGQTQVTIEQKKSLLGIFGGRKYEITTGGGQIKQEKVTVTSKHLFNEINNLQNKANTKNEHYNNELKTYLSLTAINIKDALSESNKHKKILTQINSLKQYIDNENSKPFSSSVPTNHQSSPSQSSTEFLHNSNTETEELLNNEFENENASEISPNNNYAFAEEMQLNNDSEINESSELLGHESLDQEFQSSSPLANQDTVTFDDLDFPKPLPLNNKFMSELKEYLYPPGIKEDLGFLEENSWIIVPSGENKFEGIYCNDSGEHSKIELSVDHDKISCSINEGGMSYKVGEYSNMQDLIKDTFPDAKLYTAKESDDYHTAILKDNTINHMLAPDLASNQTYILFDRDTQNYTMKKGDLEVNFKVHENVVTVAGREISSTEFMILCQKKGFTPDDLMNQTLHEAAFLDKFSVSIPLSQAVRLGGRFRNDLQQAGEGAWAIRKFTITNSYTLYHSNNQIKFKYDEINGKCSEMTDDEDGNLILQKNYDSLAELLENYNLKTENIFLPTYLMGVKTSEISVTVARKEIENSPWKEISKLSQLLDQGVKKHTETQFRFIFTGESGSDMGGLTREFFDSLFKSLTTQSDAQFSTAISRLKMPKTQNGYSLNNEAPKISEEDKNKFEQMGKMMMYCYKSPTSANKSLQCNTGVYFDKGLFAGILSLEAKDVEAEILPKDVHSKMIRAIVNAQLSESPGEEGKKQLQLFEDCLNLLENPDQLADPAFSSNQAHQDILMNAALMVGDFEIPPTQDARINLLNEVLYDAFGQQLTAIHTIAKGMKSTILTDQNNHWDNKIATQDISLFSTLIQGSLNREKIVNEMVIEGRSSDILDQKVGWLSEWIMDTNTSEDEIKEFIKTVSGSTSMPEGEKIKIRIADGAPSPFPRIHTCFYQIDFSDHFFENKDDTKENFISSLKVAIASSLKEGFTNV